MNFGIELSGYNVRVVRHGYRTAQVRKKFLTIHGRCGEYGDKVANKIRDFQHELELLAGTKNPDNHTCYEVWNQESGPYGELMFCVMFHDDVLMFGKEVVVGNW